MLKFKQLGAIFLETNLLEFTDAYSFTFQELHTIYSCMYFVKTNFTFLMDEENFILNIPGTLYGAYRYL